MEVRETMFMSVMSKKEVESETFMIRLVEDQRLRIIDEDPTQVKLK